MTLDPPAAARPELARDPDAHGEAALLLVETLIHDLIARGVISAAAAVEIVETAAQVKAEMADDMKEPPANLRRSLMLLDAIRASLAHDVTQG